MTINIEEFGKLHVVSPYKVLTDEEKKLQKKIKSINLLSGSLESFSWQIKVRIKGNGTSGGFGLIEIQNYKTDYENNKEKHKQSVARWNKEKPEYMARWNKENLEKCKQYVAKWHNENPGYMVKWKKENPGYDKKWQKEHPMAFRKIYAKANAKRKRALGFSPINEPFLGGNFHHFNKEGVICILAELHQSVKHNVFTGKGMYEINRLAFEWLESVELKMPMESWMRC